MGMEGFTPEPVVDESERVEDVEKAQVMAQAEKPLQDYAAQYDRSRDTSIEDGARLKTVEMSNDNNGMRSHLGEQGDGSVIEYVGHSYHGFDKKMSDEDIRNEIARRSEDAKKRAGEMGDLAGEEFDKAKGETEN